MQDQTEGQILLAKILCFRWLQPFYPRMSASNAAEQSLKENVVWVFADAPTDRTENVTFGEAHARVLAPSVRMPNSRRQKRWGGGSTSIAQD